VGAAAIPAIPARVILSSNWRPKVPRTALGPATGYQLIQVLTD
jgi:hypothetical protein